MSFEIQIAESIQLAKQCIYSQVENKYGAYISVKDPNRSTVDLFDTEET